MSDGTTAIAVNWSKCADRWILELTWTYTIVAKTASAWEAPGGLSDQLAAGIIAYILLAGYPPFNGNTDSEILQRVNKMQF